MRSFFKKHYSLLRENNYLLVCILLVTGYLLRVYRIEFQSFWFEELMTLNYSEGNGIVNFFERYIHTPDASPPLFSFLIYCIRLLFPYSDWVLRFPSVLFGTGIVLMTYILGKRLVNEVAGLFAAICTTSSGALIYYSQELRYNSCLVFFILTFTYLFISVFEKTATKMQQYLLIANVFVLAFLHYVGIFFMLEIIALAMIFEIKNKKALLIYIGMIVGILIIFSPWANIFFRQFNTWSIPKDINSTPHLGNYLLAMLDYSFFYKMYWERTGLENNEVLDWIRIYLYILFASMLGALLFRRWRDRAKEKLKPSLSGIIVWSVFFINIAAFFILDNFGKHRYFYEKNLLFTLPFLYILIGLILSKCLTKKECLIVGIAILGLAIYNNIFYQSYYDNIFKTEFKQAAEFISSHSTTTPVYVVCGDKRWYSYYFKKYKIENVIYSDRKTLLNSMKTQKELWVVCQHQFMDFDLELDLESMNPDKAYKSQSLVYAKLFKQK